MKTRAARWASFFLSAVLVLGLAAPIDAAEPEEGADALSVSSMAEETPAVEEESASIEGEAEAATAEDAAPAADKFIDHANWTEITKEQAQAKYDNGDNFALMVYRPSCMNSQAMRGLVLRWMQRYSQIKFYGVDVDGTGNLNFVFSKLGSGSFTLPLMVFVTDKTNYSVTTGDQDLILTKTAFEQWAGITDATAIGFSETNQVVLASYAADAATLDFFRQADGAVDSGEASVMAKAAELTAGLATDRLKLQAIHNYVSDTVYYDWPLYYGTAQTSSNASAVLAGKRAVCQGYANLTAALCRAAGIPCRVVTGFAAGTGTWTEYLRVMGVYENYLANRDFSVFARGVGSSNHAWNTAWVDGRWVIVDTTWDSGNTLEYNGTWVAGTTRQTYFDPSLDSFSQSHCFWKRDGKLSIDKTALTLEKGYSTTLVAALDPNDSNISYFSWASDNTEVATVAGGWVRALSAGQATITVTGPQNQTASCVVTVPGVAPLPDPANPNNPEDPGESADPSGPAGIQLNMAAKVLNKSKQTVTLKALALPATAALGDVSWSSSKPSVATVSGTGKVTAKKNGSATITATANGLSASCKITVSGTKFAVSAVKLTKPKSATLKQGKSVTLQAQLSPANASNKKVIWSSANPAIAKVSSKGKVTAVAPGKVKITVTSQEGGKKASITITVKAK